MIDRSLKQGKPDLNTLFVYNMPFRGIAKMMGKTVSMDMAEGIVHMCNGHFFKGLGRTVKCFLHRPDLSRYKEEN